MTNFNVLARQTELPCIGISSRLYTAHIVTARHRTVLHQHPFTIFKVDAVGIGCVQWIFYRHASNDDVFTPCKMHRPRGAVPQRNSLNKHIFALDKLKHSGTYAVLGLIVYTFGHRCQGFSLFHQIFHAGLMLFHVPPSLTVPIEDSLSGNRDILALIGIKKMRHAVNAVTCKNSIDHG